MSLSFQRLFFLRVPCGALELASSSHEQCLENLAHVTSIRQKKEDKSGLGPGMIQIPKSWNLKHLLNRLCRGLDAWWGTYFCKYLALSKLSLCDSDMLHAVFCFVLLVGGSPGVGWTCKGCLSKSHTFRGPRDRDAARIRNVQNVQNASVEKKSALQVKCWLASLVWPGTKQDFFRSCRAGRGGAGTGYEERDLT